MKKALVLAVLLLGVSVCASASLIPIFLGFAPGPGPGEWTFDYAVDLAAASKLDPGLGSNFFTIYDFTGFQGFGAAPAGWVPSSANTGVTPGDVTANDDPTIPNVTWTYIGAPVLGPGTFAPFQVITIYNTLGLDDYSGQTVKVAPGTPSDNTLQGNIGEVEVPTFIPEPASLLLIGAGLLGLGLARRRFAN